MYAAHPAARAALAFYKFTHRPLDVLVASLLLLDRCGPANPLTARQGCDIFPGRQGLWARQKRPTHI